MMRKRGNVHDKFLKIKNEIITQNNFSLNILCKDLWNEYKSLRNEVNISIFKSKKEYLKNEIKKNVNDMHKMWKCLKSLLPSKGSSLPSILYDNDMVFDNDNDIANAFNDYFIRINANFQQEMRATDMPEGDGRYISLDRSSNCVFNFVPVEEGFVEKLISKLDMNKATGSDDIDAIFLIRSKAFILSSITRLINMSFASGVFPNDWKYAKVFPLFKKGDINFVGNFRPISILPAVSKLIERIVHQQLYDYLVNNSILSKSQFGFRPGHSTASALGCLTDSWLKSIDKGQIVGALFIDLRRAFDTVDTSILLNKLKNIGLSNLSLAWFESYLNNRKQYVAIKMQNLMTYVFLLEFRKDLF